MKNILRPLLNSTKPLMEAIEASRKLIASDEELVGMGWMKIIDDLAASHDVFVQAAKTMSAAVKAGKPQSEWQPLAVEAAAKAACRHGPWWTSFWGKNNEEAFHIAG